MKYVVDNKEIEVIIEKKNNKNTYIRIRDSKIYITTNYFISKNDIKNLLDKNYNVVKKMIDKDNQKLEKNSKFY